MAVALVWMLLAAEPAGPDTVVVCPAVFRQTLQPWLDYRGRQGHVLAIVSNTGSPEEIRGRIRNVAKKGGLRSVVLVGDTESGMDRDPAVRARCVPAHYAPAKINVLWGSEPQIVSDNWYADLDDDQSPDVAIGRLSADSPEQLKQIIAKTLAYEQSRDFGLWRRQLNFVAGVGGFGVLADRVIESSAAHLLTRNIPAGYRTSMTYGSWRSPYCPDPRRFQATALERLNEGAWAWVYIGHGSRGALDRLRVPGGEYPVFTAADVPRLDCAHAAPIAVFLCCYVGAIDAEPDCLAEQMLRQSGGPVAVLAGSRVTMPYAMTVMTVSLMDALFRQRCQTLGEVVLHAKQKLAGEPDAKDQQRAALDAIAAAISPAPKQLADERAEHVLLFNLFGDPLLRLRYPKEISVEVPRQAKAGGRLKVAGTCPIGGRGTVELVVRRDRLTFKAPTRAQYPQRPEGLDEFQGVYRKANDPRWTTTTLTVAAGRFETQLDVPAEAEGPCHVCVGVEGDDDFALGAADVYVEKQPAR